MCRLASVVLLLSACVEKSDVLWEPPDLTDSSSPTTLTPPTLPGDSPVTTTDTADSGGPTTDTATSSDCELPPLPTSARVLDWVTTAEEFTFDDAGYVYNMADSFSALTRVPWGGPAVPLIPYDSWELAALRVLVDGDLVLADEAAGSLVRLGIDGTQEVILGGVPSPNSIAIAPDGTIYTTAFDAIRKVDPVTGDWSQIFILPGSDLDGLTFSPDFQTLYFNHDDAGTVGAIRLDADGDRIDHRIIAELGDFFYSSLDGMTVDECGNLYIVVVNGQIVRWRPDGTVEPFVDLSELGSVSTTSAHFGSGVGGWSDTNLYVMDRYSGLIEVEVGIRGKWEPHLPPRGP